MLTCGCASVLLNHGFEVFMRLDLAGTFVLSQALYPGEPQAPICCKLLTLDHPHISLDLHATFIAQSLRQSLLIGRARKMLTAHLCRPLQAATSRIDPGSIMFADAHLHQQR